MTSDAVGRDWMTIWESELAAAATDPELAELWRETLESWARVWDPLRSRGDDAAADRGGARGASARPDAEARAAPAVPASRACDDPRGGGGAGLADLE